MSYASYQHFYMSRSCYSAYDGLWSGLATQLPSRRPLFELAFPHSHALKSLDFFNKISRQISSRVGFPTEPYAPKTDPNQVPQPEQNISTALSEYRIYNRKKLNLKKGCNEKKCTVVSWFTTTLPTIFFRREKTFWIAWPHDLHCSASDKWKFGHLHMTVLISTWYITDCEGS